MSERHINLYGGSPLNRLSWLRPSQSFLNAIIALPNTRWILFNAGQPLMISNNDRSTKPSPIYLTTTDVKPFLGPGPYFGQGKEPGDLFHEEHSGDDAHKEHSPTESARHLGIPVVFLGVHELQSSESTAALPTSELSDPEEAIKKLDGTPYFAIDVADMDCTAEQLQKILRETTLGREGKVLHWSEPRAFMSNLDVFTAAVFASARSLVDWNLRNKYCPGCGTRTYSMWGGWKINCCSLLPWADNGNRKPCPTTKGLHNFTHPRTDAVVIMIAIDETGDKVLLGRGRKFPGKFYSALAGFIEPGETFEDAVAREMWEEAGVRVWSVKYHSGQPWPFPANLMVGFYARADSTKPIRTDLDNELVDARWFTREEVRSVLEHRSGTRFGKSDYKKMNEVTEGRSNLEQKARDSVAQALTPAESETTLVQLGYSDEPPFRLPPTTAIAGVLIRDWVNGKIGFPQDVNVTLQRGNL
ncbi:hypothetical protein BYT27DRAFT_7191157 [Phlegmacium glaucopus]|nr:hypothetical protein BYT27DRAFT_7191157 [Phlegmacium glaucopus]